MKEYRNQKGQVVGSLKDGVYRKVVVGSKHKMQIFNAWGIDEHIFKELEADGCKEIRVKDTETGQVYSSPVDNFKEKAIVKNYDGMQMFLPIKNWDLSDDLTLKLL